MKKIILPIMIALAMVVASLPAVLADTGWDHYNTPEDYKDCQPFSEGWWQEYGTAVSISSGTGDDDDDSTGGPDKAIIKVKWETPDDDWERCFTQVAPNPGFNTLVTYYAVVKTGTAPVQSVWADVWHPDGTFKYEVPLHAVVDQTTALELWNAVSTDNVQCVQFNEPYFHGVFGEDVTQAQMINDIINELNQFDTLYMGCAEISYCQPAGWYSTAVVAYDTSAGWSDPLWNWFWYIPFAAFETDFDNINYGNILVSVNTWVAGDYDMSSPSQPTVRNIGNCPIDLTVLQDDMDFGQDLYGNWNVIYDTRLGHDVNPVDYDPLVETTIPGGPIPLCTEEKLDFSIHVLKETQTEGSGSLVLTAYIQPNPFTMDYWTPEAFRGDEPSTAPEIPRLVPPNLQGPDPLPPWTDFP